MKYFLFRSSQVFLLISCSSPTDLEVHINKAGDSYCSYDATDAGSGTFAVCIYCRQGAEQCGTLTIVRILRKQYWFTPNE